MNFFKKIFSSGQKPQQERTAKVEGVYTTEYFDKRYTEQDIYEMAFDDSIKMIESFYIDTNTKQKHEVINHPVNLDQVVHEAPGFHAYCQQFQMEDSMTILTLAIVFSEYLINNFDFKLYKDSEPESPYRALTLKYNKDGGVLSLYPFEYSLKVLNNEAGFQSLVERIESQLTKIPTAEDLLNDLRNMK
jgi:hypothetical protein